MKNRTLSYLKKTFVLIFRVLRANISPKETQLSDFLFLAQTSFWFFSLADGKTNRSGFSICVRLFPVFVYSINNNNKCMWTVSNRNDILAIIVIFIHSDSTVCPFYLKLYIFPVSHFRYTRTILNSWKVICCLLTGQSQKNPIVSSFSSYIWRAFFNQFHWRKEQKNTFSLFKDFILATSGDGRKDVKIVWKIYFLLSVLFPNYLLCAAIQYLLFGIMPNQWNTKKREIRRRISCLHLNQAKFYSVFTSFNSNYANWWL